MTIRNFNGINVNGLSTFTGNTTIVNGESITTQALEINGLSTLNGSLHIYGPVEANNDLMVNGETLLISAAQCGSTLSVTGPTLLSNTLDVTGKSTLNIVDILDKNITLAKNSTGKLFSTGAGLIIDLGVDNQSAHLLYDDVNGADTFIVNKSIKCDIIPDAPTDLTNKQYVDNLVSQTNTDFSNLKNIKFKLMTNSSISLDISDINITGPSILYVMNNTSETGNVILNGLSVNIYNGLNMFIYDSILWHSHS